MTRKLVSSDGPMDRRQLADLLLDWYRREGRDLPWRFKGGRHPDPYQVWLSEIMLQQTTVAAVRSYFKDFLTRWPRVDDLANAPLDDVLARWAGLGYYARARNLHACAQVVSKDHGGQFPDNEPELLLLPGIGPYTAAAIAAIAFGRRAVVVDGNVERVMSRMFVETSPLPGSKTVLRKYADLLTPDQNAGDYAQGVMDLGAMICTPRNPACERCPWQRSCEGFSSGIAETLPRRAPKPERPRKFGVAFVLVRGNDEILFRRRPEKGLLGGMIEVPTTPWRTEPWTDEEALEHAPCQARWTRLCEPVTHTFTHFHLTLNVFHAEAPREIVCSGLWADANGRASLALPSLMQKVLAIRPQTPE